MSHPLNRREVLRKLAAGGIGAAATPFWVETLTALARTQAPHAHAATTTAPATNWSPKVLDAHQNETVICLSELIIPETDTPGAKATLINRFIDEVLAGADDQVQHQFLDGLVWIDVRSLTEHGKDFVSANPNQQTALLTRLSAGNVADDDRTGADFFQAIKAMTITGYYTTEIGLQQELGDDGQLFRLEFVGCNHPEHQG